MGKLASESGKNRGFDRGKGHDAQAMRVIDYLRISITDRCNFRCAYCMPRKGLRFRRHEEILSYEEIIRFTRATARLGITRVRITGGEPLVRRQCPELVAKLAAIPGIEDLSLTTNGALLTEHAEALRDAGLSRLNISIDSLNPDRFSRITRGAALAPVLAGLEMALELGFAPVKVNAVMIPGIEDELEDFVALARENPVHVRFIEFMPIGCHQETVRNFISRQRILEGLSRFGDLMPVDAPVGGGPARYFQFRGAQGTIGFISSMSDHFCENCNRLRLTADGKLRNCLFSDDEVDIRPYINGASMDLANVIIDSMNSKKFDRTGEKPLARTMSQIGG
jgi:cyclic pyranopterin phosphate synthase